MNCPNCLLENPENARFCANCGATFTTDDEPAEPARQSDVTSARQTGATQVGRQRLPSKTIVIGGLAGILLCCVLGTGLLTLYSLVRAAEPPESAAPRSTPGSPTPVLSSPQPTHAPVDNNVVRIIFAKDVSASLRPVGITDVFSQEDPHIVQFTIFGDDEPPAGSTMRVDWYTVNGTKILEHSVTIEEETPIIHFYIHAPESGFQRVEIEVQVWINGALVVTDYLAIR